MIHKILWHIWIHKIINNITVTLKHLWTKCYYFCFKRHIRTKLRPHSPVGHIGLILHKLHVKWLPQVIVLVLKPKLQSGYRSKDNFIPNVTCWAKVKNTFSFKWTQIIYWSSSLLFVENKIDFYKLEKTKHSAFHSV